ncbi:uncharacterized protein DFL_007117 [Arthrobotrys flagrans]|uniref:Uncharacterized protein n=1 Tax=Arthrobotrys flagrans TaxID=97331 RepID=A0A436ZUQ8_ARTFL|nr:hypothetical protein DFL_007117 [Arthrobotrys flagrans]
MRKLQRRANDYKIVFKRQIKTGPPLSPPSDGAALPQRMGPLSFYEKECELGMFDKGPSPDGFTGQPLGGGDILPGPCLKLNDLRQGLGNTVSAYVVTGYCECEFFDDDSCQIGLFSAFNRADFLLRTNGPDDNKIESVRCKKTDHIDEFNSGSKLVAEWNFEIKKDQLYTDCIPVSGVFPIRYYKINGVTCDFYGGEGCTDFKFTAGHGGKYDKKYATNSADPMYLRSFKCYPPYGIAWSPRDDL